MGLCGSAPKEEYVEPSEFERLRKKTRARALSSVLVIPFEVGMHVAVVVDRSKGVKAEHKFNRSAVIRWIGFNDRKKPCILGVEYPEAWGNCDGAFYMLENTAKHTNNDAISPITVDQIILTPSEEEQRQGVHQRRLFQTKPNHAEFVRADSAVSDSVKARSAVLLSTLCLQRKYREYRQLVKERAEMNKLVWNLLDTHEEKHIVKSQEIMSRIYQQSHFLLRNHSASRAAESKTASHTKDQTGPHSRRRSIVMPKQGGKLYLPFTRLGLEDLSEIADYLARDASVDEEDVSELCMRLEHRMQTHRPELYYRNVRVLRRQVSRVVVVGDLHGQLGDLIHILSSNPPPPETIFIFNGDFVDRGKHSCAVVILLFLYAWLFPDHVFLNRGNHECMAINELDFAVKCRHEYSDRIYVQISRIFAQLPVATLLPWGVLVVHGGIPCRLQDYQTPFNKGFYYVGLYSPLPALSDEKRKKLAVRRRAKFLKKWRKRQQEGADADESSSSSSDSDAETKQFSTTDDGKRSDQFTKPRKFVPHAPFSHEHSLAKLAGMNRFFYSTLPGMFPSIAGRPLPPPGLSDWELDQQIPLQAVLDVMKSQLDTENANTDKNGKSSDAKSNSTTTYSSKSAPSLDLSTGKCEQPPQPSDSWECLVGGKVNFDPPPPLPRKVRIRGKNPYLDRFCEYYGDEIMHKMIRELCWNDPQQSNGWKENKRQEGYVWGPDLSRQFCERNGLRYVVRSHDISDQRTQDLGFCEHTKHRSKVFTVFSASNYAQIMNNKAAFVVCDRDAVQPVPFSFKVHPRTAKDGGILASTQNSVIEEDVERKICQLICRLKPTLFQAFETADTKRAALYNQRHHKPPGSSQQPRASGYITGLEWELIMQWVSELPIPYRQYARHLGIRDTCFSVLQRNRTVKHQPYTLIPYREWLDRFHARPRGLNGEKTVRAGGSGSSGSSGNGSGSGGGSSDSGSGSSGSGSSDSGSGGGGGGGSSGSGSSDSGSGSGSSGSSGGGGSSGSGSGSGGDEYAGSPLPSQSWERMLRTASLEAMRVTGGGQNGVSGDGGRKSLGDGQKFDGSVNTPHTQKSGSLQQQGYYAVSASSSVVWDFLYGSKEGLELIFRHFDTSRSGTVTRKEFYQGVRMLSELHDVPTLPEKTQRVLRGMLDGMSQSYIKYSDFFRGLKLVEPLNEFVASPRASEVSETHPQYSKEMFFAPELYREYLE